MNALQESSFSLRFIDKKMRSNLIWLEAIMFKEIHAVVEGVEFVHVGDV